MKSFIVTPSLEGILSGIRIFVCILIILSAGRVFGQVSGTTFRDFNQNGTRQTTAPIIEPAVGGVVINAYNSADVLIASYTSTAAGEYNIPATGAAYDGTPGSNTGFVAAGAAVRVEFVTPPNALDFTAASGGSYGSSVQFVSGGATAINFAINNPGDYCQSNPPISIACYVIGSGPANENAVVSMPYNSSGQNASAKSMLNTKTALVGATWGIAYQGSSSSLFESAFMKRHSAFGTGGTGAIYITNNANVATSSSSQLYVNLNGLVVSNISTGGTTTINTGIDPHQTNNYNRDVTATNTSSPLTPFDAVGKMSLGGMSLSEDGSKLYVVSLNDRLLVEINIGNPRKAPGTLTGSDVRVWDIPNANCTGGQYRPFGVNFNSGKLYLGVTCDGSTSFSRNDIKAVVYELDPQGSTFTQQLSFPLNYDRKTTCDDDGRDGNWLAWTNTYNNTNRAISGGRSTLTDGFVSIPQALVSDIDFEADGRMIIALMDRSSHQLRHEGEDSFGNCCVYPVLKSDLLMAGKCGAGTPAGMPYTLENNAVVCGGFTGTTGSQQGVLGGREFYQDQSPGLPQHCESTLGGIAVLPGTNEVATGMMDPFTIFSQGISWLNNTNGSIKRNYEIVPNGVGAFGKGAGLGDIAIMCSAAPIEIGNRVWNDFNKDGIQDANETTIEGVIIELVNSQGIVVGTATTNSTGNYYFNNTNVNDTVGVSKPNVLGPQPNSAYTLRISSTQFTGGFGTGTLANLQLTQTDATGTGLANFSNNDASLLGGFAQIAYTTGGYGQNNHTLDFGLTCYVAAPAATVVQSTCAVATGTITITSPTEAGLTYSFDNGVNYGTSATSGALAAGVYQLKVKNAAGCESAATAITINAQPATPAAPAATVVQPTCAVATGTITITSPTEAGLTYSFDNGANYGSSATSGALAAGVYQLKVKNAAGCESSATAITIIAQPATPAAPAATVVQPTCAVATGTITIISPMEAGLTYSFDNGVNYG